MAGLRQEEVARAANVSAPHLSRVENGDADPNPRWVGAVSAVLAAALRDHGATLKDAS